VERLSRFAFIIGAQKAGTTNLAYILDQHPDIVVSVLISGSTIGIASQANIDWLKRN